MYRRIVVTLKSEDYERLQREADREERAPDQQATWFVRRALEEATSQLRDPVPT
jgi:hypothetical protein